MSGFGPEDGGERLDVGGCKGGGEDLALAAVVLALDGEEAVVAGGHGGEGVADKVGLGVVVGVGEDVGDGDGIGGHETAAADEAAVDEGVAELLLPAGDEAGVLLVVHLGEVAHEEGRRRGPGEVAERGDALADEEGEEGADEEVDEGGGGGGGGEEGEHGLCGA